MPCPPKLFAPIKVGNVQLEHRVVFAPLTRFRATKEYVPVVPIVKEYYTQRASMPGTLLITEGTYVGNVGGYDNAPGIWNDEQVKVWKEVTDAVHSKGCHIFMQLWAPGRAADPTILAHRNLPFVSPSAIPIPSTDPNPVIPKELSIKEIQEYVQMFAQAARNAVHKAGFDGVEVHCANGYLIDQFLQDTSNQRTDEYGGSIENRSRFPLEIMAAVCEAVGEQRAAVRVSVWSTFQGMRMADPMPQFVHFISRLKARHPSLAYLHVVEPRISGDRDSTLSDDFREESNDFLREIWKPNPFMCAGGYKKENAVKKAEETGDLIAFGRYFISNPDLPLRLMRDIPLSEYDRKTFYVPGDMEGTEKGYIDYPFAVTGSTQSML